MQRPSLEKSPWVREHSVASIQDSDINLTIEMHHSMWSDEFMNYSCRDLCVGGRIYQNPEILTQTSDSIKYQIMIGGYVVSPRPYTYYKERDLGISGYAYIHDTPEGMRIGYQAGDYRERTKTRR